MRFRVILLHLILVDGRVVHWRENESEAGKPSYSTVWENLGHTYLLQVVINDAVPVSCDMAEVCTLLSAVSLIL